MAKKVSGKFAISAKANAKIQAVAKVAYQRKRVTTEEVPPDVTRAKAGAWLSLISPITEWAGLKGDALNFKRRLFRIQQEETLLRVAQSVREKLSGDIIGRVVPPKILIPALERASLEDTGDQTMIDRWSNLLASATQVAGVQPRFVGILGELAGAQAVCLERVAFNNFSQLHYPAAEFEDSCVEFTEHNTRRMAEIAIRRSLKKESDAGDTLEKIVETFNRPGVLLGLAMIMGSDADKWEVYDSVLETGLRDEADLSILESLGLIRYVGIEFSVPLPRAKEGRDVFILYHYLTQLGVDFCKVCSGPRVQELENIDARSRQKSLKRQQPFWEK